MDYASLFAKLFLPYYRCTSHQFGWGWVQVRSMIGCCFFSSLNFWQTSIKQLWHPQHNGSTVKTMMSPIGMYESWCIILDAWRTGWSKRIPRIVRGFGFAVGFSSVVPWFIGACEAQCIPRKIVRRGIMTVIEANYIALKSEVQGLMTLKTTSCFSPSGARRWHCEYSYRSIHWLFIYYDYMASTNIFVLWCIVAKRSEWW